MTSDVAECRQTTHWIRRHYPLALGLLLALIGLLYLMVAELVVNSADQTVRESERFLALGDVESASNALNWLMWFEPEFPPGLLLQGQIERLRGNSQAGIEFLRRVPVKSEVHRTSSLLLAELLAADGQFEAAEIQLLQHRARYTVSPLARDQLVELYFSQLRVRDAVRILEQNLSPEAEDLSVLRPLLLAEFMPPNPFEKQPLLEDARQKHPGQPDVDVALGKCFVRGNRTAEAESLFRVALKKRPEDSEARIALTQLLIDNLEYSEARRILWGEKVSSADAVADDRLLKDDRFWSLSSSLFEEEADLDDAVRCLNRALEIRIDDREYLSQQVRLMRRQSRKAKAAAVSKRQFEVFQAARELFFVAYKVQTNQQTMDDLRKVPRLYRRLGRTARANEWDRLIEKMEDELGKLAKSVAGP